MGLIFGYLNRWKKWLGSPKSNMDVFLPQSSPSSEELDLEQELSGSQAGLYTFLKEKDKKHVPETGGSLDTKLNLAPKYIGALYALRHKKNPYRFPLAAHSLRELIEKLLRLPKGNPKGVPTPKDIKEANENYEKAKGSSREKESLDLLLSKVSLFCSKSEIVVKNNKEKARDVFQESSPDGETIPGPLLRHKTSELMIHHKYFLKVSHGSSMNEMEFNGYVKGLEDCLLAMFNLRYGTEIDRIIKEAEKDIESD